MKEKIYFIPGLMTDNRLWQRALPFLEDYFTIVHTKIPNSTNFDEIIEILDKEFIEERINILGFSLGGYIASYFTCKKPNRVKKLFTVSATPGTTSKIELERREKKLNDFQNSKEFGLEFEKAVMLLEEQNQNDLELVNIIVNMFNDLGRDTFISQLKSTFNRVDLFDCLKDKVIPIHMLFSTNDRLLDNQALNKLFNQKHNIKLISREGTSHNIPLEFPELFANSVKNWMKI
ncbi:Alpha/beta hydrolase family protein [Aliarcobacter thereius]|uniref:Alpha/beta fold hydrolase n=2 Tax=Aliarcobacter thereius TaxID=544718 RepID=A0A1C0B7D3_9BACT|nr:alpha/beta hydrolase [Aliarcobacter thereius]OCL86801.1 Alpha/beta hydrolase family protein [Aliarcobacter thereius]OCL91003.1 Alpha/beta hydrolase family protein [Aliarcobacter thereius]OCL96167.1 Alpha/beta hydrolase family protein [Aliarcobacter thereius LMG 24486]OCL99500.1 Alpha/beta hydrolase family protein [Aliarcobacter thereius]QBF15866.1 alpha/beta hydrolase family protein [Aliarcobacter thereius LMG 24486]